MSGQKVRIVHYLNQFFGGIGGEKDADLELQVREGPVGPGLGLRQALGAEGEVAATLICGDNYFNNQINTTLSSVLESIRNYEADVVVAGPAFNAGRYGFACGEVCKAVAEQLGLPAVTAMYPENPAVETYRKVRGVWILPTGAMASDMRRVLPKLAAFVQKVGSGKEIAGAKVEGYIPTGQRKLMFCSKPGAERAINMLLAKLSGGPFQTEIPAERFEHVPPAPPIKDLKAARVSVITTSGLVPKGNPDHFKMFNATEWRRYALPNEAALRGEDWEVIHGGFNTAYAQANPNLVLPLDALRALAGKVYGELDDTFYTITGVGTSLKTAKQAGEEIARSMRASRVDAALLVATWGTCTRCGAALSKELDRAGIPVVTISAMAQLAQQVGASRVVVGRKIPHPCGDPNLPEQFDFKLREEIVTKALEALETAVSSATVFRPTHTV